MSRKYKIQVEQVTKGKMADSVGCNGISFTNQGSDNALINGYLLKPGSVLMLGGHEGEEDTTMYDIVFQGNVAPRIDIVRKVYIK